MTTRGIICLSAFVTILALALASSLVWAVNAERRACKFIGGGPVVSRWSLARGCWIEVYPYPMYSYPVGPRPRWLRLP